METRSTESLTGIVANYIERVKYSDIPRSVLDPIRVSVIDAIGCGVVGSTSKEVKILTGYFAEMKSAGESVVWGTSIKACAPHAAAANAAAVHAWDFDDTVLPGIVHPAGIVVTTALSIAEKYNKPVSGQEFMTAVIAGYEVGNLMSAALGARKWRVHGFYNTVPVIFAAAATAGKLLGLSKEKLVGALGIAATQAAGLYSATMTKRLNAPKAVEGGIYAAELANRGFEAPTDGIGDEQGFLKVFSRDPQWEVIPRDIGKYAFEVYHKQYPCIRSNQPSIYAARMLQDEHPSEILAQSIRKITVHADTLTRMYTVETPGGGTEVKTIGNALVSLPYCLAAMLVEGQLTLAEFTDAKINNPMTQGLLKKVEILVDPEIDKLPATQRYRATVTIDLTNGKSYTKFCPAPKGDPENRLSSDEIREKFLRNTSPVFETSKMDGLFEILNNIDNAPDVRRVPQLLASH
jgi:aconitate decarboxylase